MGQVGASRLNGKQWIDDDDEGGKIPPQRE